ncbi:hypothetical protein ACFPRL_07580 [Pseudoclavibacter helvolus]
MRHVVRLLVRSARSVGPPDERVRHGISREPRSAGNAAVSR